LAASALARAASTSKIESDAGRWPATAAAIADPARRRPSASRACRQAQCPAAKRFHAAKAVEDVAAPAPVTAAAQRVDHAEHAGLLAELAGQRRSARLEGNGEDEAAEISARA
jgi:hypothetical protein